MTPDGLQDRLIEFAATIGKVSRRLPRDVVGAHVAKQLVRSSTSPAANYAEARAAESPRDFVHKMQICLKELRETSVWLRLVQRLAKPSTETDGLAEECVELTSIFAKSVSTTRKRHGI